MTTTLDRPVDLPPASTAAPQRGLVRRLLLGRAAAAAWERPALIGLLVATAILYIVNLGANGWANSFYSAAVQAGSVDWTAFFYGSSDAANSITVDKPPASLWLMALSVRIFGLSSWSILLPEALMGVATVGVVYAAVRRHFSAGTALLAGAALAVTPVATLMFRFNNPDALLVLLLTLATYFTLRGVETGRLRWVLWAGVMIGLGFLTKQLQAFLILPVLAGVYLWAAPLSWPKRIGHSFAALGAVLVSAGWWVAIVELVPESWRPYIGGSQDNSFLELTFGYNGLGRLTGDETGSVGGGGGNGGGGWGSTGLTRLLDGEIGGQIAWLLPAALVLLVVAFLLLRRAPRVDARRAAVALFGGWMVVTALAFSFMAGIFHAYYTVALAPAIAVVVATGASLLWSRRDRLWARITAAVTVLGTSVWALVLLMRAGEGWTALGFGVVALGAAASVLLLLPRRGRMTAGATVALALLSALLAPAAYSVQTVATAHTGSIVTAGPTVAGSMGGPGGGGMPGGAGGPGAPGGPGTQGAPGGTTGTQGGPPALPGQSAGGTAQNGTTQNGTAQNGTTQNGTAGGARAGGPGGMGGLLGGGEVSSDVVALVDQDASSYTWAAAAIGSNNAAGYQLESGDPVMPIGGFNGSDPSPTLAQFQEYVESGQIHWFIGAGSIGQSQGGSSASSEIATWVAANFDSTTVDGVTLYDLTS